MLHNFALDPLSCWGKGPGTPLEIKQACDGLARLARGRHGSDSLPLLDRAHAMDPDACYELGNATTIIPWVDRDESLSWLWVAGSLGHRLAAEEISVLTQTQALHTRGQEYGMLVEAARSWVEFRDGLERNMMSLASIANRQKNGDILDDVDDPEGLGAAASLSQAKIAEAISSDLEEPVVPDDGMAVVEFIGDTTSKEGTDLLRRYGSFVKRKLPWQAKLPRPGEIRKAIAERWPWAADVAAELESYFAVIRAGDNVKVRLAPILFVGEKGCGKTSMAAFLCDFVGLNTTLLPCGGVADGGGLTAVVRGWATTRPSALATTMFQQRVCNPAFVLDEIDKSTVVGSQNGSVMGALLSMLRSTSYFDQCLQAPVNISGVSFIATANNLKRIDSALLDRFKVIHVPNPRLEDFEILLQNVRQDFIADYGLWPESVPHLSDDERAVLREWLSTNRSARSFSIGYERLVQMKMAELEQENVLLPN